MHWWVGMLLHAVCVFLFFFSKEKKNLLRYWLGLFPTHVLASMVLLIWITFHSCHLVILFVQRFVLQISSLLWSNADDAAQPFFFFCLSTTPQLACFFLSYYTPFISHNQVIFEFILVLIPSYLDLNDRRKWAVTVFMYCWQLLLCGNLGRI